MKMKWFSYFPVKFPFWLIPTWGTATAEVTAMLFPKHIIYENGIALEIVSDRDSKFTSKFWTAFHAHL
jgi:hypothetical protein